jgi:hypothetical protein
MNYKTKINKSLLLLFVSVFILSACNNDDDPEPENETEIITRVEMKFTNTLNPSEVVLAKFDDPDGPGGNAPIFTHPTLKAGTVYSVSIELYNDLEGEDITEEIEEEDDEHQFFFIQTGGIFTSIVYDDVDAFGRPVGLKSIFTTGTAGTGTLRVVLRHQLNKAAAGVASGDITNAGGDTDIDIIFNVTVQ